MGEEGGNGRQRRPEGIEAGLPMQRWAAGRRARQRYAARGRCKQREAEEGRDRQREENEFPGGRWEPKGGRRRQGEANADIQWMQRWGYGRGRQKEGAGGRGNHSEAFGVYYYRSRISGTMEMGFALARKNS